MPRKKLPTPKPSESSSDLSCYRADTIYEDQSGFFIILKGERIWFDTIELAMGSKKYKRLFVLYSNRRVNGKEYAL